MYINNNNNTHNPASPNLNLSEARRTLKASVVLVTLWIPTTVPYAHEKAELCFTGDADLGGCEQAPKMLKSVFAHSPVTPPPSSSSESIPKHCWET